MKKIYKIICKIGLHRWKITPNWPYRKYCNREGCLTDKPAYPDTN